MMVLNPARLSSFKPYHRHHTLLTSPTTPYIYDLSFLTTRSTISIQHKRFNSKFLSTRNHPTFQYTSSTLPIVNSCLRCYSKTTLNTNRTDHLLNFSHTTSNMKSLTLLNLASNPSHYLHRSYSKATDDMPSNESHEPLKNDHDTHSKKNEKIDGTTTKIHTDSNSNPGTSKSKSNLTDDSSSSSPNPASGFLNFAVIVAILLLFVLWRSEEPVGFSEQEIDFPQFESRLLKERGVQKLVIIEDIVHIYPKNSPSSSYVIRIGSVECFEKFLNDRQLALGYTPDEFVPIIYNQRNFSWLTLSSIITSTILIGLAVAFTRASSRLSPNQPKPGPGRSGPSLFDFPGAKKPKLITAETRPNTKFKDVAGLDEAKVEVIEFVSFLKNPEKYKRLGADIPRGALLVGRPGTGKTLLAKAAAGEAQVPFFSTTGSDFVEMFVGVGPSRIRELFAAARKKAPCIIFIDEIDAVARTRSSNAFFNDERENTLNQLLVEMDGFNTMSNVLVLAGTNRADILDKALTRPGRFDRVITIDSPTRQGRVDIFGVHLKPLVLAESIDKLVQRLADLTPGFVGADIANVCNEAALIAARSDKTAVEMVDLEAAIERVVGGMEKKSKILDQKEKKIIAYHEAGHAVMGWFLEHADPLLKVSIIPRGSAALGYSQYESKDQYLISQSQLLDTMCMALGGRASESIIFNWVSTGAKDDLERVTNMAFDQVTKFGFSKKIGLLSFKEESSDSIISRRLYSDKTSKIIDDEVRHIVNMAYERTLAILNQHRDALELVSERLLEKETISGLDMIELLGERPFPIPSKVLKPSNDKTMESISAESNKPNLYCPLTII